MLLIVHYFEFTTQPQILAYVYKCLSIHWHYENGYNALRVQFATEKHAGYLKKYAQVRIIPFLQDEFLDCLLLNRVYVQQYCAHYP